MLEVIPRQTYNTQLEEIRAFIINIEKIVKSLFTFLKVIILTLQSQIKQRHKYTPQDRFSMPEQHHHLEKYFTTYETYPSEQKDEKKKSNR